MSKTRRSEKRLYSVLIFIVVLAWLVQQELTPKELHGILARCYVFNTVLAVLIYVVILRLKDRHSEKIGFVFLIGSGLKFLLFFLLLYPAFNADGELSSMEFASFFIPYALTTVVENVVLVRQLSRS
jgi:F0F1-type ATP synthase assembly protein I